jgi:hypothetical protein
MIKELIETSARAQARHLASTKILWTLLQKPLQNATLMSGTNILH